MRTDRPLCGRNTHNCCCEYCCATCAAFLSCCKRERQNANNNLVTSHPREESTRCTGGMYAPAIVQRTLKSLHDRALSVTAWGDAQAAKAMSLASIVFWAPLTVPYGVYQFSLGLYPVQELLLKPLLLLQASKTVGLLLGFSGRHPKDIFLFNRESCSHCCTVVPTSLLSKQSE